MPWIPYSRPPGEAPAHYKPPFICDRIILGSERLLIYAKDRRKEYGQIREGLLAAQKLCGKDDRENARSLRNMASDYMVQYRIWESAIKYLEGDERMIHHYCPPIQEEIAAELDRTFDELNLIDAGDTHDH